MKVLWCGPFLSDAALKGKRVADLAASKWSRGLLRGLEKQGCEIRVIDHCPEQRWPRGNVFWQDAPERFFLDWYPCEKVSYCNVAGLKGRWLDWAYARAARRILKSWIPDVVLCYNSLHPFNVVVMSEAAKNRVKSVPIILDGNDPRKDNWKKLLNDNRFANGVVFLSYWMYMNYPDRSIQLLHMDGGADAFRGDAVKNGGGGGRKYFNLVHTGALDHWRGLDFMKDVVRLCRRQDVRFVFCGKCDNVKMWAEFGNDPRVEIKGFLSDVEVDAICRDADVFLNVRDPKIGENILNYPSKVPQYLSWGKPVISTWIDSFSPDYREVLCVDDDNSAEGFVNKLDEVLDWGIAAKREHFAKVKAWYESHKTWRMQAERVKTFIEGIG